MAVFTPAFEQLVARLRGRVRYPAAWDAWEEDDRDDFRRARQDVGDALLDAAGQSFASTVAWLHNTSSSALMHPLYELLHKSQLLNTAPVPLLRKQLPACLEVLRRSRKSASVMLPAAANSWL